jgi:pheromone shutdown-related protein TraB
VRKEVKIGDKEVVLVGTAHVSEESRREVKDTIDEEQPDLVAVELDENRLKSLREDSGWRDLDLSEAIKDGQAPLLFTNLLLSIYQRHLGLEQGMKPGEEMLQAVETAEEDGVKYTLIDRDINETLSRAYSELSLWDKLKLLGSAFVPAGSEELDVEELKDENILDALVEELKDEYPTLNRVFLEERNSYMAEKLIEEDFEKAVVVVGAAHVEGMAKQLEDPKYEVTDSRSIPWSKIFGYGLPAAIIAGIAFSFYSGFSEGVTNLKVWFASNSILAMLGAMAARSHPVTWLVSFVSSPLTSLNPAIPAGLVAAYSESKIHPPTVGELEEIGKLESYRELWDNQVGRILLTFFLVNLGSGGAALFSAVFIFLFSVIGI